jgi:hypothetical protein
MNTLLTIGQGKLDAARLDLRFSEILKRYGIPDAETTASQLFTDLHRYQNGEPRGDDLPFPLFSSRESVNRVAKRMHDQQKRGRH